MEYEVEVVVRRYEGSLTDPAEIQVFTDKQDYVPGENSLFDVFDDLKLRAFSHVKQDENAERNSVIEDLYDDEDHQEDRAKRKYYADKHGDTY